MVLTLLILLTFIYFSFMIFDLHMSVLQLIGINWTSGDPGPICANKMIEESEKQMLETSGDPMSL